MVCGWVFVMIIDMLVSGTHANVPPIVAESVFLPMAPCTKYTTRMAATSGDGSIPSSSLSCTVRMKGEKEAALSESSASAADDEEEGVRASCLALAASTNGRRLARSGLLLLPPNDHAFCAPAGATGNARCGGPHGERGGAGCMNAARGTGQQEE